MTGATREPRPSTPRPASKQRLRLWLRLMRAPRAIEAELRERLRVAFRMTLPQFDVMAALARKGGGMTMTELSRFLIVSNGNVTGIIDRLATEDMVARAANSADRRATVVRLTAHGKSRFASIAQAHETWVDELLAGFNKKEVEAMIGFLDGLAPPVRGGEARP